MFKNKKIILGFLLVLLFAAVLQLIVDYIVNTILSPWVNYDLLRIFYSFTGFMIFNLILSILPLIVLLIRNPILKRKKIPLKSYLQKLKKSISISLIIIYLTNIFLFLFFAWVERIRNDGQWHFYENDLRVLLLFIGFFASHAVSIYFSYRIVCRNERRQLKNHPELAPDEVLDSPNM